MAEYYGAWHMIGQDEYEPQRQTNFWIYIYEIEGEEVVTLTTRSVGGISYSVSDISVPYGNTKVKFAGLPEYQDIDLVFNDFIGKNTQQVLSRWFATVFNPNTQVVGRASVYKKTGLIVETAPDGTKLRSWRLLGAWPSDFKVDGLEYGSDEQVKINMTLKVDYVVPETWSL